MASDATTGTAAALGASPVSFDHRTLSERVHDHLRDEIMAGRLGPGAELQEVGLAQSLGVSRGPVREALGRLAAEGLVTVRPRRGAVVRSLSQKEFVEAYQLREALEAMAVRLAVPRLTEDAVTRLEGLIDEMEAQAAADDVHAFFEANRAFHETFFDLADNRMLAEAYRRLRRQIDRYQLRSLQLRGELRESIGAHEAILRAAQAGDADRAVRLVSEHIRVPQMRLLLEEHAEQPTTGGDDR